MDVLARKLRTAVSTAATVLALPAVVLATAGTAHATVRGLNVNFTLPPFHKDFVLGLNGTTSWQIPGIPTGTLWPGPHRLYLRSGESVPHFPEYG